VPFFEIFNHYNETLVLLCLKIKPSSSPAPAVVLAKPGASRGIGKAIGLKLAAEGANIVIASKSVEENPKLGGTIFSAAAEMEAAGGKALAVQCDIRFEEQIQNVVNKTVEKFGGIDILINNAS